MAVMVLRWATVTTTASPTVRLFYSNDFCRRVLSVNLFLFTFLLALPVFHCAGFNGNASYGSPSGLLSSALYHNNNAILSPVHNNNNNSSGLFGPYATNRSLNATPSNTLTNPANSLHQSHFTFPDEMIYNSSFQPNELFAGFNPAESHDPVGFSAVEHYNQVGFSPTILTVLMSFEELQQQLKLLLSPASMALTALMQRFIGTITFHAICTYLVAWKCCIFFSE